jgi:hypothetical protein
MTSSLLTLTLIVLTPTATPAKSESPRKPHPFALSLRQPTDEEEAEFDRIIDNFILYDTGGLKGVEGQKALAAFQKLPPEATFALIRGLNRASAHDSSCPAVVIAKKLNSILRGSTDSELLEFARENINGLKGSRHMGVIKDLRVACMLRKNAVDRMKLDNPNLVAKTGTGEREMLLIKPLKTLPNRTSPGDQASLGKMSLGDLAIQAELNRGSKLRPILIEIEKRDGDTALDVLAQAAGSYEKDIKELGATLLVSYLSRKDTTYLKKQLAEDRAQIRLAAAKAVGKKGLPLGGELIELLKDRDADVQQAAALALVQISKGKDFGPKKGASDSERDAAISQWKVWWATQTK